MICLTFALILVFLISFIPGGLGSDGVVAFTSREALMRSEYGTYYPPRTTVGEPFTMEPENMSRARSSMGWSFPRYKAKAYHYYYRLSRGELYVMVKNWRGQLVITPVRTLFSEHLMKSLKVFLGALAVGTLLGCLLGCITAFSRILRGLSLGISIGGLAIPDFLLVQSGWLLTIWTYKHFDIRLWSVSGDGSYGYPWLLPLLVLSIAPMGYIARLTTSALDEVMLEDYIRTARAKGLRYWKIVMGHAFRNVLPRVMNGLPAVVQITLSSLILVEGMTFYPGLGAQLLEVIDSDVTATAAMIFCAWYVVMDGIAHTIRLLVNPRLREVA